MVLEQPLDKACDIATTNHHDIPKIGGRTDFLLHLVILVMAESRLDMPPGSVSLYGRPRLDHQSPILAQSRVKGRRLRESGVEIMIYLVILVGMDFKLTFTLGYASLHGSSLSDSRKAFQ